MQLDELRRQLVSSKDRIQRRDQTIKKLSNELNALMGGLSTKDQDMRELGVILDEV